MRYDSAFVTRGPSQISTGAMRDTAVDATRRRSHPRIGRRGPSSRPVRACGCYTFLGSPLSFNYIHLIPSHLASSRPSLVLFAIRSIDGRIVFGTLPITAFSFVIILCIPPYPLRISPTFAFNLDPFCLA
jgi:hypothetical protein